MTIKSLLAGVCSLMVLAACGDDDFILPGERFDIRPQTATLNEAVAVSLPAQRVNSTWTHRNGSPSHAITHPALGADLTPVFVANVGEGDSDRARITAHPVVAGGLIFTLDARARVTAFAQDGTPVWTRDLTPRTDTDDDASGGGLTFADGTLYVTTGFGEITALDAASGQTRWVQDLDAPAMSPATVRGNLVYLVARDSTAWALESSNGRIAWQQAGAPSVANFGGGAAPATQGEYVVFPFPSGEVQATYPLGGIPRWSAFVAGERLGSAAGLITDIAGDPVISGNRVYIGNFGGRTVAIDLQSGERLWTAGEGAISPVWPVGNAVYLINDINELVRLDARTGAPIWRTALPRFEDPEDTRRQNRVFGHYGPVLAGGRLIVTSSDGVIRSFDPASGALVAQTALPGGAATGAVVANQTLYVVSKDGQLHAFR
ncbi:PQQ-like beta-propeller repeat protein [Yoonia litorea]|uniref:Outer membrane protein assembly factor BamB, contains PQQ-like beta-propeller repeat n=1 Tax=Yoonia litorea TaxID=1123755 RepID=A0A1I6LVM9_9RHOB|nr:PQQ-like beta-propeller repeat protein [Yoonia litorea]SFS07322.1 Outer membrane protein assembly factor BamB, contains PQQ-like beta-propeller repeat [Yoonia litorea]